jgi:transaldolase / glucose-6-phosphate isomerase
VIVRERLGPIAAAVGDAHDDLLARHAAKRMWAGDHTLWQEDPTEVADRLGWLHVPDEVRPRLGDVRAQVGDRSQAALLGMGGSSLFPEVLNRSFPHDGSLAVLDTTDPAAIARVSLDGTTFIAASKSGTTIETTSQLAHFWEATRGDADRFVAITDPGTQLARYGEDHGFHAVFENRADIGGRYSALSWFGLVPATMLGIDTERLLTAAAGVDESDGVRLAAILGAAALRGRDKLTFVLPDELASFGLWLEQLVAESTGKHGRGIVPIAGEPLGTPDAYGNDRIFVALGDGHDLDALATAGHPVVELQLDDLYELGAHVLLWEMAIALSGVVLGINPFDQPDVQSAKDATTRVLQEGLPSIEVLDPRTLLDAVMPGDYLAVLAFVDPGDAELAAQLERARHALRDRLRVATTVGIGPRFLHSTGQLHKGGPPTGVFLQVLGDDPADVDVPGAPYSLSTLKQAQAAGDLLALQGRGLRAGRVTLASLLEEAAI